MGQDPLSRKAREAKPIRELSVKDLPPEPYKQPLKFYKEPPVKKIGMVRKKKETDKAFTVRALQKFCREHCGKTLTNCIVDDIKELDSQIGKKAIARWETDMGQIVCSACPSPKASDDTWIRWGEYMGFKYTFKGSKKSEITVSGAEQKPTPKPVKRSYALKDKKPKYTKLVYEGKAVDPEMFAMAEELGERMPGLITVAHCYGKGVKHKHRCIFVDITPSDTKESKKTLEKAKAIVEELTTDKSKPIKETAAEEWKRWKKEYGGKGQGLNAVQKRWKNSGIDIYKHADADLIAYAKMADTLIHAAKTDHEVLKMVKRAKYARKKKGVKYYHYWTYEIPEDIHKAIISMIEDSDPARLPADKPSKKEREAKKKTVKKVEPKPEPKKFVYDPYGFAKEEVKKPAPKPTPPPAPPKVVKPKAVPKKVVEPKVVKPEPIAVPKKVVKKPVKKVVKPKPETPVKKTVKKVVKKGKATLKGTKLTSKQAKHLKDFGYFNITRGGKKHRITPSRVKKGIIQR